MVVTSKSTEHRHNDPQGGKTTYQGSHTHDVDLSAIEAAIAALDARVTALEPVQEPEGVSLADYGGDWTAAMNAAKAQGNRINVPAGVWPVARITPYAGLTIAGVGPASIIARNAPGPLEAGGFIHAVINDVTVSDVTLRGYPLTSGKSDDIGVYGRNAPNLRVLRVVIEKMQGAGIFTEGATTGALFEDVVINETTFRSNGYHGVAVWCYKGSSGNTYRRVTINGADFVGVSIDAGTTGSTDAASVNDNVFEDVVIRNAGRKPLPNNAAIGAGFMFTGGRGNTVTRWEVTDQVRGPALAFGADQSGIGSTQNTLRTGLIARIASGDAFTFGGGAIGNLIDGGSGSGRVVGASGNTILNWPGLT